MLSGRTSLPYIHGQSCPRILVIISVTSVSIINKI
uniref:Uncharacterized protein n=1 Tax=Anguilla anguilla TaxID=7936 RepID=A0A0E9VSN8_ANGAN